MKKKKMRVPEIHIIEDEPIVEAPKPARRARFTRQQVLIRIGVLLPLVLLAFSLARGASDKKQLPDSLLGVWQTSDPHYVDCYMEVTPATILFGNAENGYLLYFVSSFEESQEGGSTSYLVRYTDLDGVKYQMTVVHRPPPRETLSFSHQAGVNWTRRPSS